MATLSVPDMHCQKCVERITKALTAAALDFSVNLDEKTVTINGNPAQVAKAVMELDDLGFSAKPLK